MTRPIATRSGHPDFNTTHAPESLASKVFTLLGAALIGALFTLAAIGQTLVTM
jgi:hypothetical protein